MEQSERIRRRAHQIWEADGRPEGREAEHWARAQDELRQEGALDADDALGRGYEDDTASADSDRKPENAGPADGHIIEAGEGGTAGGPDEADEAVRSPVTRKARTRR